MDLAHLGEGLLLLLVLTVGAVGEDLLLETGDHEFRLFTDLKRLLGFLELLFTEDVDERRQVGPPDIVVPEVLRGLVFPL